MATCPKTTLSKQLTKDASPWAEEDAIEVVNGNAAEVVRHLKAREGKDNFTAYGGVQLLQNLLAGRLVDELFLIVEPISLGKGGKVFKTRETCELV